MFSRKENPLHPNTPHLETRHWSVLISSLKYAGSVSEIRMWTCINKTLLIKEKYDYQLPKKCHFSALGVKKKKQCLVQDC